MVRVEPSMTARPVVSGTAIAVIVVDGRVRIAAEAWLLLTPLDMDMPSVAMLAVVSGPVRGAPESEVVERLIVRVLVSAMLVNRLWRL